MTAVSGDPRAGARALRVLLVDDEVDFLAFLAEAMRRYGCQPIPVTTVADALGVLDRAQVDLVVSDIRMPGSSGLDLLEAVAGKRPRTPVVLLTGWPSLESAAFGARHGAYDYLTKPISLGDLAQLVQRVRRDRGARPPATLEQDAARRQRHAEALVRIGQLALEGQEPAALLDQILLASGGGLQAVAGFAVVRDDEESFTYRARGQVAARDALPTLVREALAAVLAASGGAAVPISPPGSPVDAIAAMVPTTRGGLLLSVARAARRGGFLPEECAALLGYARAAALAVDRLFLGELARDAVLETVGSLIRALQSRDPALKGHAARVSLYAAEIAAQMTLLPAQLVVAQRAGLLHDLGKLTILDTILTKPAGLTPEEYDVVREHPLAAERMLRPFRLLAEEATVVRHHAERYDGTGYPDGRAGAAIPLLSRIVAVADAFDAMTSPRPYRAARPLPSARAEIARHAGTQFDPTVVRAFGGIPAARVAEISRLYRLLDDGAA